MPDDIFVAVAKALGALQGAAGEVGRTASALESATMRFRSKAQEEERTQELLERIEQRHKGLVEAHRTLESLLKSL